jgi:hypothetical protein
MTVASSNAGSTAGSRRWKIYRSGADGSVDIANNRDRVVWWVIAAAFGADRLHVRGTVGDDERSTT